MARTTHRITLARQLAQTHQRYRERMRAQAGSQGKDSLSCRRGSAPSHRLGKYHRGECPEANGVRCSHS